MRLVHIDVVDSYDVVIDKGLLSKVGEYISRIKSYGKIAIIADDTVAGLYLDTVKASVATVCEHIYTYAFPHGESSKCIGELSKIYDFLAESEITRSDLVIALGGGVVGDMVGFGASTYLRGVDFVNIPTTLLSAVDSSVGGKTAVNISAGKNQVGAFYQPKIVLCDTNTMCTLSEELIADGVGEIAKYAILQDQGIFQDLLNGDLMDNIESIIAKCVDIKRYYVAQDVYDKGLRQLLNLGHTLGHVIEKDSKFGIAHGKAVLMGMYMLTKQFRGTPEIEEIMQKLSQVALKFGMSSEYHLSVDQLWHMAVNDKKRHGNSITLARPYAIGDCRLEDVKIGSPINLTSGVKNQEYDIVVANNKPSGSMNAVSSKSDLHRVIICAAFCGERVVVDNVAFSEDIMATIGAVRALGARVEIAGDRVIVERGKLPSETTIDCKECGSTFRFFLPICAMLGVKTTFLGSTRLGERGYTDIIQAMGGEVSFDRTSGLPLAITGQYTSDSIAISGESSSQFVSGILMGSYATRRDMTIDIVGKSKSIGYVDMTIDTLSRFGMICERKNQTLCTKNGDFCQNNSENTAKRSEKSKNTLSSDKNQDYMHILAESDYSNGAFFTVAGVDVKYNNPDSLQGDKRIVDIVGECEDGKAFDIDIDNIPDLAPILCVLATRLNGTSVLHNCARLRIKECDRLETMHNVLTKCGIDSKIVGEDLYVTGGKVRGGVSLDSNGDHRIAMACAVLATFADSPITITNAQVVKKSYPDFWEDFARVGGKYDVINIR